MSLYLSTPFSILIKYFQYCIIQANFSVFGILHLYQADFYRERKYIENLHWELPENNRCNVFSLSCFAASVFNLREIC